MQKMVGVSENIQFVAGENLTWVGKIDVYAFPFPFLSSPELNWTVYCSTFFYLYKFLCSLTVNSTLKRSRTISIQVMGETRQVASRLPSTVFYIFPTFFLQSLSFCLSFFDYGWKRSFSSYSSSILLFFFLLHLPSHHIKSHQIKCIQTPH